MPAPLPSILVKTGLHNIDCNVTLTSMTDMTSFKATIIDLYSTMINMDVLEKLGDACSKNIYLFSTWYINENFASQVKTPSHYLHNAWVELVKTCLEDKKAKCTKLLALFVLRYLSFHPTMQQIQELIYHLPIQTTNALIIGTSISTLSIDGESFKPAIT